MFETYEKQSEGDSRYGRIALAAFIGGLIYIAVLIFVTGAFESDAPQEHTLSLNETDTMSLDADDLCASLPMPERMKFTGKREPKNDSELRLVIYRYQSPRRPEEIMPHYLLWLAENGWQGTRDYGNIFRKGNSSIYITYQFEGSITAYEIYCSEKR